MTQTITELQAQVSVISTDISALEALRESLRQEQSSFQAVISFPKDNSPKSLAEFHQQQVSLASKRQERLKEIDRMMRSTEKELKQKQALLAAKQAVLDPLLAQQLEERLLVEGSRLQAQAQKINQLSSQLEVQLRVLRGMYEEINPIYCQWLQKQADIVKFSAKTIPYVFVDSNGFELKGKLVDWEGKSKDEAEG